MSGRNVRIVQGTADEYRREGENVGEGTYRRGMRCRVRRRDAPSQGDFLTMERGIDRTDRSSRGVDSDRRGVSRRALLGGLASLVMSGRAVAAGDDPADPVMALVALIRQRLDLMEEVARSKWNLGIPVEDSSREQSLIDSVDALARGRGVDPALAATFFRAQIEAAKLVQSARISLWAAMHAGTFAAAADLRTEIRPKLDRLTADLLSALAAAAPTLKRADADRIIAAAHGPDTTMSMAMIRAVQPLLELCGVRPDPG